MDSMLPIRIITMIIKVGAMPGIVTYRSSWSLFAPSTFIASYKVGEIPMMAAKYTIEL